MSNEKEKDIPEGAEEWRPEEVKKEGLSLAEIFEQAKAKIGGNEAYERAKETEARFHEFAGKGAEIKKGKELYGELSGGKLISEETAVWEVFGLTTSPTQLDDERTMLLKTYGGLSGAEASDRLKMYQSPTEFLSDMKKFLIALETAAEQSIEGAAAKASYTRNAERGRHVLLGFGVKAIGEEDYNSAVDAFVMTGFDKKNWVQERLAKTAEKHPLEIAIALEPHVKEEETEKAEVTITPETEA